MDIDIASKLFPNITTLIVQLLSTAVMLCIFKKFLWKPIQIYFEKRADFIEGTVNDAKDMQLKAKTLMEESEKQSREAAKEYRNIVEQAKEDAGKTRDRIIEEANEEAREKLERASKEIEAEKQAAKANVKNEIVDIALEVATKVMNKEMDKETNEALVNQFIKEMEEE